MGSEHTESRGGAVQTPALTLQLARVLTSPTSPHTHTHSRRRGEHLTMVKTTKMELLRALVSDCLSAAAEEILKIVEKTIVEYEEDMSCSKWVVDRHRRLLDAAKSHTEGQITSREIHSFHWTLHTTSSPYVLIMQCCTKVYADFWKYTSEIQKVDITAGLLYFSNFN